MVVAIRYRAKNGENDFGFRMVQQSDSIALYCTDHPPLAGRSSAAGLTHKYSSGQICFVSGREPRTWEEAHRRAAEWAEFLLRYIATGRTES